LIEKEAKIRNEDKKNEKQIHFIACLTPNKFHYEICEAALKAGFHVLCDKPITDTVEQAQNLVHLIEQSKLLFCLTHTYAGKEKLSFLKNKTLK